MIRTVVKVSRKSYERITCNTLDHRVLKSLFNCGIEVLRYCSTDNGYCKLKSLTLCGSKANLNVTVLTGTAVLLLMLSFNVHSLGDLLSVSHLRLVILNGNAKSSLKLSLKMPYSEVIREVAGDFLHDNLVRWERLRQYDIKAFRLLMRDYLHLNPIGNAVIGLDLARALDLVVPDENLPWIPGGVFAQKTMDLLEKLEKNPTPDCK